MSIYYFKFFLIKALPLILLNVSKNNRLDKHKKKKKKKKSTKSSLLFRGLVPPYNPLTSSRNSYSPFASGKESFNCGLCSRRYGFYCTLTLQSDSRKETDIMPSSASHSDYNKNGNGTLHVFHKRTYNNPYIASYSHSDVPWYLVH